MSMFLSLFLYLILLTCLRFAQVSKHTVGKFTVVSPSLSIYTMTIFVLKVIQCFIFIFCLLDI